MTVLVSFAGQKFLVAAVVCSMVQWIGNFVKLFSCTIVTKIQHDEIEIVFEYTRLEDGFIPSILKRIFDKTHDEIEVIFDYMSVEEFDDEDDNDEIKIVCYDDTDDESVACSRRTSLLILKRTPQ